MPLALAYVGAGGEPQTLVLDASISEQLSERVVVTEHPVESGADVADHVRQMPITLRIEGLLTDFPLPAGGRGAFSAFADRREPGAVGRSAFLYELLSTLRDSATVLAVHTGAGVFGSMVIESLDRTRDRTMSGAIRFTMSLKQVRVFYSQAVAPAKIVGPLNATKTHGGEKEAAAANAADAKKSWLKSLVKLGKQAYSAFDKGTAQ